MTTFKDLNLNPLLLQALEEMGFENPTPIQEKTIPHLMNSDNDLVGLAQTGTGKTAAFALPVIQQLDDDHDKVQSLILCPTRELALQISEDIQKYIKYMKNVRVTAVYGGERIDRQIRDLKKKPQIVVGTPGRVNDMIRRRLLKVESIRYLVLDEADEMLNMGFKEELDAILENMPEDKQVLLFSATMNPQIRRIASNYMRNTEEITVGSKNQGAKNVNHFFYVVHEKDRYQVLRRIADANPDIRAIVFCRTRRETQQVADKLILDHYSAEAIHGEVSQEQRTHVMNRFKDKKVQLLVATDVAARGIDVSGLTHVINYTLPESGEAYLHRSGRTGRANNLGSSLLIVNMREQHRVRDLERKIGKPFEKGKIPSGDDICERQLFDLIDRISDTEINEAQIGKYIDVISKKFEDMDREEMIKKFVSVEFNRFLEYYKDAVDLNSRASTGGRDGRDGGDSSRFDKSSVLFARFNVNIGRELGMSVKELMTFLNSQPTLRGVEFGDISIQDSHTLFEVDQRYKEKVLRSFSDTEVEGVKPEITCEETGIKTTRVASSRSSGGRSGGGRRPSGRGRDSRSQGGRPGGQSHRSSGGGSSYSRGPRSGSSSSSSAGKSRAPRKRS